MDVKKIASEARITLTEEEIEKFSKELMKIEEAFSEIDELEISDEPCFHPLEVKPDLREDEPGETLTSEEALSNAESEDGFFKGPRVM
ncbi:MAG: Asp-tRNA(Asn)/Glu-tRNA(Gln) amidotransferase subunit GatC [Candidatus Micrarchaeota archaeon]|nr:Asp-tRNA(Asn)/Glu-tRNA(Gln) amidotransferase subunit GatC [Candidatus Micrarchaeota archaeon]